MILLTHSSKRKAGANMGLVLLTKDRILADYLRADCPLLTAVSDRLSSLKAGDVCIVDADSFMPPYPAATCLLISHKKQETQLPLLLRPLSPGALEEKLSEKNALEAHLHKEQRVLVTQTGALSFPPLEFALLSYLFERKGQTVSRKDLALCLKESEENASQTENTDALLTVYIYRLRKKLTPLGFSLISHHRQGYSLEDIAH